MVPIMDVISLEVDYCWAVLKELIVLCAAEIERNSDKIVTSRRCIKCAHDVKIMPLPDAFC